MLPIQRPTVLLFRELFHTRTVEYNGCLGSIRTVPLIVIVTYQLTSMHTHTRCLRSVQYLSKSSDRVTTGDLDRRLRRSCEQTCCMSVSREKWCRMVAAKFPADLLYVGLRGKVEDRQDLQGLISADRNSKATLPLTIPRPIRVVCRRSSPRNCPVGLTATTRRDYSSRRTDRRLGTRDTRPLCGCSPAIPGDRCRCVLAWILT